MTVKPGCKVRQACEIQRSEGDMRIDSLTAHKSWEFMFMLPFAKAKVMGPSQKACGLGKDSFAWSV